MDKEKTNREAEAALSRATSEPTDSDFLSIPMVIDRATGAKGAYCIRRFRNELRYEGTFNTAEYWNLGKWTAFCYVFNDKKLADCVCELLALAGETHTAGGWISVKEKLPPRHQNVWCLNADGIMFEGRICVGMHEPFFTYPRGDGSPSNTAPTWINVTHWQLLPSPPKEGQ